LNIPVLGFFAAWEVWRAVAACPSPMSWRTTATADELVARGMDQLFLDLWRIGG
jgi:hypothetical protein